MKKISLILLLSFIASSIFATDEQSFWSTQTEESNRRFREMTNSWEEVIERAREERQNTRDSYEARLRNAQTLEERAHYARELERLSDQEERAGKIGENIANASINVASGWANHVMEGLRDEQRSEHELNKAAAVAYVSAQEETNRFKQKLDFLKEPKTIGIYTASAAFIAFSVYASKYGLSLAKDLVWHYYRNPSIAQETSLLSFQEKLSNKIWGKKDEPKNVKDVILDPELEQKIETLAKSVKNTVKNGAYFQNVLLYGPPGTGKTMVSQRIARSCGLDYIYFAASSLLQLSEEEALIKVTELFEFAKKSSKKLMIIVDEAEKLFAHRKKQLNDKTRNILTQILTYTGTESRDYMIVGLTNLPDELDPAFLNRCDEQINIAPPTFKERVKIIEKYVKDYLLTPVRQNKVYTTMVSRTLAYFKKEAPVVKLNIEPNCISKAMIQEIAKQTEGFVGRDIAKMILSMQAQAFASDKKTLTKEIVNKTVESKIKQYNDIKAGFKHKFAGI